MKKKLILFSAITLLLQLSLFAQQYNEQFIDSLVQSISQAQVAKGTKFLLTGYVTSTAEFTKTKSSLSAVGFTPILLWKPHDRILVETELETGFTGNSTNIELGYADVSFYVNKYLSIRAGKFLSPFGIFQDRLHPSWINKLPTFPLGTGEDQYGVGPISEVGINFKGGAQLGESKINYSFFASNNAQLITDPTNPIAEGTLSYGNMDVQSKKLTVGGRVGFLPFSNSTLELGVSYRNGYVGDTSAAYQNVNAKLYAFDLSYDNQLDFLKGDVDIKAQYNKSDVSNAWYIDPSNPTSGNLYTYNNSRSSYFLQAAYTPSMFPGKFLKKTQLIFRYAGFTPPTNAIGLTQIKQYTYGIDYWFNWRTALKFAYQSQKDNNVFFVQLAVGF